MILDFLAKTIKPLQNKGSVDAFLHILEQTLQEATKQLTPNTSTWTGPNRGDMSEGVVGAALVAAFLSPNKVIQPSDIVAVLEKMMLEPTTQPKKGKKAITRECLFVNEQVQVRFVLCLAKVNFDGLSSIADNSQMVGYLAAATSYANSHQIRKSVHNVYASSEPLQEVSILAGGCGRPYRSKCDIVVSHNSEVIPWGNVTLKCDNTKQLAMVSRNFDPSSFTSQSRGIRNLIQSVLGVDVSSPQLRSSYDSAVAGHNKEDLLQVVETTYQTACDLFNERVQTFGNLAVFQHFALGVQKEALGDELDLIQIRLDDSGIYTYVDYQDLVLLSGDLDFTRIQLKACYKAGVRESSQPYLYIQAVVDGIDFGNLVSLRPKIRHHENGKIKEFKHYLQNEPGLEALATYAAKQMRR